ncbi:MAG: hypothetical protein ACI8P0_001860 [Planctomycetaceae bacterium]
MVDLRDSNLDKRPLALTISSPRAYDDSSKYLYKLWLPSYRDESFRFVAHHLIAPPWSFSMVASRLRFCLTALSLAGVLAASQQTLAAPAVTTTLPQAVAPGSQTDVKVRGSGLTGTTLLWTSFPGKAELTPDIKDNGKNAAEVTWRLNLPADIPVGIHGLRTAGPSGSSALKLIMVDDLPSVAQAAGNTVIDKAQEIAPLTAVDGAVANLSRNYYRVKVAAGQKLSIEVVARRLGSALDPLLRILDANGRELTYSDDEPGLRGDARLQHTFAAAGDYVIEVRDIRYQGGAGHFYRLRVGDFPCLSSPYPMGVTRGSVAKVSFVGPDTDGVGEAEVRAPSEAGVNWVNVAVRRGNGKSSGFAMLRVEDAPVVVEAEPNNELAKATRVELGSSVNGRIDASGDVDHFVFTAKKGQKYRFNAVTRRQGVPTSAYFRLLKADGGQVAAKEDFGVGDAFFDYTFPADGDYTLAVEELHRRGGAAFAYRVEAQPITPTFDLTAAADTVNVGAGSTAMVTVNVVRRGYNGPIQVAATNLPAGIASNPTVLGPGMKSVVLTLTSGADTVPGTFVPVSIVGRGKNGTEDFEVVAATEGAQKAQFSALPWGPQNLDGHAVVAVSPKPQIRLRPEVGEVIFGKSLSATVKVLVDRDKGFDEAVTLAVTPEAAKGGLPGNVTVAVTPIAKGKNEAVITFTATDKAPLGDFTAVLTGTIKQDKTTVVQTVPGITLRLQAPMTLVLVPAGDKLTVGTELKAKVTVQRNPALKGEVVLTFQNLPKGVTVAAAKIPADQNETEVTLVAAADAAKGAISNLSVKAEATVGKVKVSAVSANIALTVE